MPTIIFMFTQIVLLCLCFQNSFGQVRTIPLDTSIKNSEYIFEGTVISSIPYLKDGKICTSNVIRISKIFKGHIHCGNVEVTTMQNAELPDTTNSDIVTGVTILDCEFALEKGNAGIFMCVKAGLPPLHPPVENPNNLQVYAGGQSMVSYNIYDKDTIVGGSYFKSPRAVWEYICTKTGHNYSSCAILQAPGNPGGIEDRTRDSKNELNNLLQDNQNAVLVINDQVFLGIAVYPNPVKSILKIKVPNVAQILFLTLYDDSGKTILKKENINSKELQNFDVSGLKPGHYSGIISSDKNNFHFKFVKI